MKRVEFKLSMPNKGSWNGGWSGQDRNYIIVKNLPDKKCQELEIGEDGQYWVHRWDDGWCVGINARIMSKGEREKRSDGFCGYNWIVNNILQYGTAYDKEE